MKRCLVALLLAASPAVAELTQEECRSLMLDAAEQSIAAAEAHERMRREMFARVDEDASPEEFARLYVDFYWVGQKNEDEWEEFTNLLGEICRDKL